MNLPDKPSELLEKALEDLEECEKTEGYMISMEHWHYKNSTPRLGSGKCKVCMAGSVLACKFDKKDTFVGSPTRMELEGNLSTRNRNKLLAIDEFRSGNIQNGLEMLSCEEDAYCSNNLEYFMNITSYSFNRNKFKEDIENLILILKDAGL